MGFLIQKNHLFHHQKKTDSVLFHKKKISFCSDSVSNQNQNRTENSDSDDLKWVKKDKIVIISCYHFLYKSESENSVSSWFYSVSSHQIEVWFCLISWKMNLILSYFTEKKFDLISLKLLLFFVSSHFTKKFPVLSHFMKIKSDSVSSHWKKISFCLDSDLEQNWIRMGNSDSCDQSSHEEIQNQIHLKW